jgi:hypothetical protein
MDVVAPQDVRQIAYGQAVWSCPANAGDKPVRRLAGDGGKKAGSPGRSRSSRNTIAQGVPCDFGVPVLSLRASFCFARKAVGASCTRHSLRPPFSEEAFDEITTRMQRHRETVFCRARTSSFICLRPWFGY